MKKYKEMSVQMLRELGEGMISIMKGSSNVKVKQKKIKRMSPNDALVSKKAKIS